MRQLPLPLLALLFALGCSDPPASYFYTFQFQTDSADGSLALPREIQLSVNGREVGTMEGPNRLQVELPASTWVSSARAEMSFPSSVLIEVTEHEPHMLLALDELWYVNADGQPFCRAEGHDLDYPVLTGIDPAFAAQNPELTSAIIGRSLSLLDSTEMPPLHGSVLVSEIRFHTRTGFAVVLRSGTELMLGFADPDERLARLGPMVEAGLDLTVPQRIDLVGDRVATASPLPEI